AGIVVLLAAGHAVRRVGLGVAAAIALLAGAVVAEARLAAAERPAAAPLIGRSVSGRAVVLEALRRRSFGGWSVGARLGGGRAQAAVAAGLPQKQAALARGMVLGQDDALDDATREEFRASGLSHLLAASGQNVVLLALLATTGLGLLGAGLRARLAGALVLVALYVPLAGAGPSIQRAGVMGAAGLVAGLAGRPASRLYALLLAAAVTLVLN